MLKQNNWNGKQGAQPDKGKGLAGRPSEFWKNLLRGEGPIKKPEPVARVVVERLPKEQLKQILENLKSYEAEVANMTWNNISKDLGKLNAEDACEIMRAALSSRSGIRAGGAILASSLPEGERSALFPLIEKAVGETLFWAGRLEGCRKEDARTLVRLIAEYMGQERIRLLEKVFEARRFNGEELEMMPALRLLPTLPEKEQGRFFRWAERLIAYEASYGAGWLYDKAKARGMLALFPAEMQTRIIRACFKSPCEWVQETAAKLLRDMDNKDRVALIEWFIRRALSPRRDWNKQPVYGDCACDVAETAFTLREFQEGRGSELLEGLVRWLAGPWHTIAPLMRMIRNYPPEKRRELYDFAEEEVKKRLGRADRMLGSLEVESYLEAFPKGRRFGIALCALESANEWAAKAAIDQVLRLQKKERMRLVELGKESAFESVRAKANEFKAVA